MRRIAFVAVLCALAAAPALAEPHGAYSDSGRMYYGRIGGYYQGRGGEFTLRKDGTPDWLSNSAYADVARVQDGDATSFQTFCIETGEFVSQPMDVWVSEQNAALTGPGSHAWLGGAGGGDDLGFGTAYLYTQFATGQLFGAGYYYSDTGSGGVYDLTRAESAGALQRVIWALEGEGGDNFAGSFMDISLTGDQQSAARAWLAAAQDCGWTGIGDVRVIQTYTAGGGLAQDQLYLVPVPAAVLLGMLGLGAAGLKLRKFV